MSLLRFPQDGAKSVVGRLWKTGLESEFSFQPNLDSHRLV